MFVRNPLSPEPAARKYENERLAAYRRRFRVELLLSSVPVFIGALWSSAIMSVLGVLIDRQRNTDNTISASFGVAIFIHGFSLWLIYQYTSISLGNFVRRLVTECSGFAWKDATYILILHRLSVHGIVVGSCAIILICVFSYVYVESYIRMKIFTPGTALQDAYSTFNSEVFSLCVSFALTQTVNSIIYGKIDNQLYIDDDSTDDQVARNTYWAVVGYTVGITFIVLWNQRLQDIDMDREEQIEFASEFRLHNTQSLTQQPQRQPHPASNVPVRRRPGTLDDDEELEENSCGDLWLCFWNCCWRVVLCLPTCCIRCCDSEYLKQWLFDWDNDDAAWNAMKRFVNTAQGYLIGCAWFVLSMRTFGVLFDSDSKKLGASLAYAVLVTVPSCYCVSNWQLSLASRTQPRFKMRRRILLLSAFRLTVGWAWEVVMHNFLNLGGTEESGYRPTIKLVAAILLTAVAVLYEARAAQSQGVKPSLGGAGIGVLDTSYLDLGEGSDPRLDPLLPGGADVHVHPPLIVEESRSTGAPYSRSGLEDYNVV